MIVSAQKYTLVTLRKPNTDNVNVLLQWFGTSLGLFSLRDKDKSQFRIFIELLKSAKTQTPHTSDELASTLELTRGTVIHHINKLMAAGLVIHEKNTYLLRVENLQSLIAEIEEDLRRTCESLRNVANEIDEKLRLN